MGKKQKKQERRKIKQNRKNIIKKNRKNRKKEAGIRGGTKGFHCILDAVQIRFPNGAF